jgi:hypothetical protein
MKKISYIIIVAASSLWFSCENFLAEEPKSIISEDQYYKTPADALTAVNATYFFYNGGGSNGSGSIRIQFIATGRDGVSLPTSNTPARAQPNPDVRSLSVHNHSSTNRTFYENWQQHYAGIRKANVAIDKIALIDFGSNDALKNVISVKLNSTGHSSTSTLLGCGVMFH